MIKGTNPSRVGRSIQTAYYKCYCINRPTTICILCYNNECEQGTKTEQSNVGLPKPNSDAQFSTMFTVMCVFQIKSF